MSYTILEKIKIRLRKFVTQQSGSARQIVFETSDDDFVLEELIDKAKKDIRAYRHYPDTYTEADIEADIENNYSSEIIDLVLYDYSIEGADYEVSHSENGVNRTYISKDKILGRIIPFVKVL